MDLAIGGDCKETDDGFEGVVLFELLSGFLLFDGFEDVVGLFELL